MKEARNQESYYKILGTTAKISQKRIKEKYLKAIREHPPEKDPERFEQIREAYEVLKDPKTRETYDLMRQSGGKLEKLHKRAWKAAEAENYQQALDVFEKILKIDPKDIASHLSAVLMCAYLDRLEEAVDRFNRIDEEDLMQEVSKEEITTIYMTLGAIGAETEKADLVYPLLKKAVDQFGAGEHMLIRVATTAALQAGERKDAVDIALMMLPEDDAALDDIDGTVSAYGHLFETLHLAEDWSRANQYQTKLAKLIKQVESDEEKEELFDFLEEEADLAEQEYNYRVAELFLNLAKKVMPADAGVRERLKYLKRMARVEKEMFQLMKDTRIFPKTKIDLESWYFDDPESALMASYMERMQNSSEFKAAMEDGRFEAASVLYVKKKYSAVYQQYKERFEERFEVLTKDMNRDEKRELKYFV